MAVVPSEMYDVLKRHLCEIDMVLGTCMMEYFPQNLLLLRKGQQAEFDKLLAKYEQNGR